MRLKFLAGAFSLLIAWSMVAACSPRDGAIPGTVAEGTPSGPAPTETRSPAETPSPPPALDEGLQRIMERVAAIRQLDPLPGLNAVLIARPDVPPLIETLLTDEDRMLMAQATTLYRLLGHFSTEQDYLTLYQSFGAESILGLYSPLHDTLWVVYDGEEPTFDALSPSEEETLAHEFVHALQDYHFDLDQTYDQVGHLLDRGMAWTAVVEGDASVHDREYSDRYLWAPGAGRIFSFGVLPQIPEVPLTFIRELLFPYTTGALWVDAAIKSEGLEYINELLVDPPVGTICVFHLERCLNGFQPAEVVLPGLAPVLGGGWAHESGATLGEFHLGNFLDVELPLAQALAAADGWVGDRYDVYVDGDRSLLALMVEFADGAEAGEFESALLEAVEEAGGNWSGSTVRLAETDDGREFLARRIEPNRVLVVVGSEPGFAGDALDALHEGTP